MNVTQVLEVQSCYKCFITFAAPEDFFNARRKDRESFHCPMGHSQVFVGKSNETKLREDLNAEQQRSANLRAALESKQRALVAKEREAKRLKRRAAAGVCPCCKRTISQMAKHMKTMHPEYAP